MKNERQIRVIKEDDLDSVLEFVSGGSPAELDVPDFDAWNKPNRRESLEHYLKLGWSFGAFEKASKEVSCESLVAGKDEKLIGYILCQPFVFFQSLTQVLWVERLEGEHTETLFDVAYRTAKGKHLQSIMMSPLLEKSFSWSKDLKIETLKIESLKTAKWS